MKKIAKISIISVGAVALAGATTAAIVSCKQPNVEDLKPAEPVEQPVPDQPSEPVEEPSTEVPEDPGIVTPEEEEFKITVTATSVADVILRKDADNSYMLSLVKGTKDYMIPILYLGTKGLAKNGVYKWNQKLLTFEAK